MQNDWPTQAKDMATAFAIIDKHTDDNDGAPLPLIELTLRAGEGKPVSIKISDWVQELIAHFQGEYGMEQGHHVASKVITRYLLKDETIH